MQWARKDLGKLFWQSPGNASSLVGTRGDSWEAQLDLPEEFFQTLPEGSQGLEMLTHHCRSATKAHRDREENQLCLPPRAQMEVSALQSV